MTEHNQANNQDTVHETALASGPLAGVRVLDLSRILAGPTATQLFGDLGAEVMKIERPGKGDDTRAWGPPFVKDGAGNDTTESAYYLSTNRNKRSLAIDLTTADGQEIIRELADRSDIVIENFKVDDLKRRGLDYETLSARNPRLIYCSITGFGQTGPYRKRAGYDFLIQGMGGMMSLTGAPDEEGGKPTKVGVGIADVMCGMYAAVAILAALQARHQTGRGQYIDLSLLDTQVAWLINQGAAYLTSGEDPVRLGNGHPTIVPYETFPASDGDFIIAVGNDGQFQRLCRFAGAPEIADDPRFKTNSDRVKNRKTLIPMLSDLTRKKAAAEWITGLESLGVPCGPVNDLSAVFTDPQIVERGMKIRMPHSAAGSGHVDLVGNPIKFSETPVTYRHAPPEVGIDTRAVLNEVLGLGDEALDALEEKGTITSGASK